MLMFELAQLETDKIVDDQNDAKNIFEPADWLRNQFDVTLVTIVALISFWLSQLKNKYK